MGKESYKTNIKYLIKEKYFIRALLAIHLLFLLINLFFHQTEVNKIETKVNDHHTLISQFIHKSWQTSIQETDTLRNTIIASNDIAKTQSMIARYVEMGNGLYRYNWFSDGGTLITNAYLSSSRRTLNIYDRPYIKKAIETPNTPVISETVSHKVYGEPIMVRAIALSGNESKEIKGILTAVYPLDVWKERVNELLASCPCDYSISMHL